MFVIVIIPYTFQNSEDQDM